MIFSQRRDNESFLVRNVESGTKVVVKLTDLLSKVMVYLSVAGK